MSALRDIRLLVARRLDEPPSIKAAVLNVLNVLDVTLDSEGFQDTPAIKNALDQLQHAILDVDLDDYVEKRELDVPEDAFDMSELPLDNGDDEDDDGN